MADNFFKNRYISEAHVELRHGLFDRALHELYRPQPAPITCPRQRKEELYQLAARTMPAGPITYLEFGVHTGWSFSRVLQQFAHPDSRFFGFDSFEGLPERWSEDIDRGHFSTDGETPSPNDDRAAFVKGWFQNTVQDFLKSHPITTPTLVHFDADLYSSTLFLLTTIWNYIPNYYFVFDEFQPDEIVAMHDFTRSFPVEFRFIASTNDEHMRPQQVLGELRTVDYTPW